jgi:hypothetical protein
MKTAMIRFLSAFFIALLITGCSGNKSEQSVSKAEPINAKTVEEVVQEAVATADKEIPNAPSIAGDIPVLLNRRAAALEYLNNWMMENQQAIIRDDDALEKSKGFASDRDSAFLKVEKLYAERINTAVAQMADKEIPLELDNRYFTEGTVKVREAGESLVYFSYDLKAVEDRRGYYRVVVQYFDEAGNELGSEEAMSANITTKNDVPVCCFDQSASVTDLAQARKLRVTLHTED